MSTSSITPVLHVEDSPTDALLTRVELEHFPQFHLTQVDRLDEALRVMAAQQYAVVLLDLGLPDSQGLDTLLRIRRESPQTPVVVMTGNNDEELGLRAVQAGAQDYLVKGQSREHLLDRILRYAIERNLTREALRERAVLASLTAAIGLAFTRSASLRDMLQSCAVSMVGNLGAAFARIWTLNEGDKVLELQASAGVYTHLDGPHSRVPVGKFKIGLIAQEKLPHLTNDVPHDPRVSDQEWAKREGMVAFAGYPLLLEGRLVGVMAMFARKPLSVTTLEAMAAVANTISLGIERKQKEEALRQSQERFQELTAHIRQVLWMIDATEAKVVYVSPAYDELWGRPRQSLIDNPRDYMKGIHPLDIERMDLENAAMYQTGRIDAEFRIVRSDESVRWAWIRGYPVTEQGRIVRVVGVIEDITEKRQLAAERDALLARLQLHIARMPLAYVLFNSEAHVIDWNPAAERIFGYAGGSARRGAPYAKFVPRSFWEEGERIRGRVRSGDMQAHSINENLTKDGRRITCEWFNTPLMDDQGKVAGFLCLAQDITQRRTLEAQFHQAQKMEAVGQLAGGIAHDFNNLLTVISGYSAIVLSDLGADDPMRDCIQAISEAGARAANLTRQLLAFSRKAVLEPKVLELNEVVRETEKLLRRLIGEDVQLSVVLDSTISRVKVDPGQLGQVLMNLAVNARDAMPTGGKLTVETRSAELDQEYARAHPEVQPGRYVLLSITDTGSGMSAEVKARIFEPFFTTKGIGKGTGLGLAVVLGIVKQSGGHLSVYSEPGIGTTFKVYLPAVEEKVSVPQAAEVGNGGRGSETVLLVEDEEGVRGLAALILKTNGYKVLVAANGKDALRLVEKHPGAIELLVTDVVMPIMGGPALAEALRPRFPKLQVLYTSGYTDDAVVRHGLLQEQVAFLQKPYSPVALVRKVRQLLDEKG